MKIFDLETHKFADIFPMVEGEELEQLKQDIKEQGLLQPIVLFEGKLLDGRNRYKACKETDVKPKFEEYKGDKPLEFVISLNLKRRHLTPSQAGAIGQKILELEEDEAKKRHDNPFGVPQEIGGLGQHYPHPSISYGKGRASIQAKDKLKKMGIIIGERYLREAKRIKEKSPENFEEMALGHKTMQDIKKEERFEKIKKQREELDKNVLEKPTGLFDVIVCDPPWRYDGDKFKEREGLLPSYEREGYRGTVPYMTMSLEEIKNIKLPIKEDCVLWLWTTNLFLPDCYPLLKAWGFELKSMVTWDKRHIGTGRWLRSQTEHCLLTIKGKPFFNNTKWSTLISEKRTEHSVKPEIFYTMVDEICAGRKLDYFARKKRKGWEVYGDEVK